ncbi:sensor histidine kinase [Streptomyces sp. CG 926]|uniref:sensor histidine kinase n=1 Tax=Streptomyces sp. CG 926 TaxID=1882405 RepID=UPI000D6B704F|nr:histidine kinase [Streptomyces sp. CG 926]
MPFVVPRSPDLPPATWASYAMTTAAVLPLAWRRRAPVGVLAAILVIGGIYQVAVDGPGQPLPYAGLIAFYTVAVQCTSRVRAAVVLASLAVVALSMRWETGTARELLFTLFVSAAAYALGRLQHTRQAYTAAVEARAVELERVNRIEAEQAAARERARIAREMHDILSHAVSIMIVQAEAGPVAVRRAPERAEAAFEAIAETGRDAMAQLRAMLGVLRSDEAAPRSPQPGIAGLAELVDRVRAGGLRVSYERTGAVRELPAALEATVHRVVQEALTNVVKHAGAAAADVTLVHGPGTLTVTVTDDGRGPGGAPGGHGLIGIRERAAAHGGTAWTGPGPGGRGFSVRVELVTSPLGVGN